MERATPMLKGALGAAGGAWSLPFERSLAWPPLQGAMKGAYDRNPYDYELALVGLLFEKVQPITTSSRILANPLPDTPAKQLFITTR